MSQKLVFTKDQLKAINHDRGHLRIIACPGSGKTEVVSRRIARMIANGVDPRTIVAFTFTEKAAEGLITIDGNAQIAPQFFASLDKPAENPRITLR